MKRRLALLTLFIFGLGVVLASCAGMTVKPTAENFKAPTVALDSVQLAFYEGFWTYGKAEAGKGKAPKGGGSSAVTLDFVFDITNPNKYPVKLDSAQFFLYFEDYELRVVNDNNPMWIPAEKTNAKVLSVTLTPNSTFGKFILTHAIKAKERGDSPWELIEKWWTGLPDMSFPIGVNEGSFVFSADGLVKVVPVVATDP
jgi:LEA14-like dessication related protein